MPGAFPRQNRSLRAQVKGMDPGFNGLALKEQWQQSHKAFAPTGRLLHAPCLVYASRCRRQCRHIQRETQRMQRCKETVRQHETASSQHASAAQTLPNFQPAELSGGVCRRMGALGELSPRSSPGDTAVGDGGWKSSDGNGHASHRRCQGGRELVKGWKTREAAEVSCVQESGLERISSHFVGAAHQRLQKFTLCLPASPR